MKAWEILKLLEEGNTLENDIYELYFTNNDKLYFMCKKDGRFDNEINLSMLKEAEDWKIKQEPIPFEKALEYMKQGRICQCNSGDYKMINNELLWYDTIIDKRWIYNDTSFNLLNQKEWYLLPEEK